MKVAEVTGYPSSVKVVLESEHTIDQVLINLLNGCEGKCSLESQAPGITEQNPTQRLEIMVQVKKDRY